MAEVFTLRPNISDMEVGGRGDHSVSDIITKTTGPSTTSSNSCKTIISSRSNSNNSSSNDTSNSINRESIRSRSGSIDSTRKGTSSSKYIMKSDLPFSKAMRTIRKSSFSAVVLRFPFLVLLAISLQTLQVTIVLRSGIPNLSGRFSNFGLSDETSVDLEGTHGNPIRCPGDFSSAQLKTSVLHSCLNQIGRGSLLPQGRDSCLIQGGESCLPQGGIESSLSQGRREFWFPQLEEGHWFHQMGVPWLIQSTSTVFAAATEVDYVYDPSNFDYDYGDPNMHYHETIVAESRSSDLGSLSGTRGRGPLTLPLCCPEGSVFDYVKCTPPTLKLGGNWRPHLDGASTASFEFKTGFPVCTFAALVVLYQSEVFFQNTSIILPRYVQQEPATDQYYCVTKVDDPHAAKAYCPKFDTKIYVCIHEDTYSGVVWTLVGVGHVLLVLVLTAYIIVPDLRALQGQYLICLVLSLLLYDVCLFPTSVVSIRISDVSCIALKAVKYFFFCGVFLWFNVICFDVWRTLRAGADITGRRRFFLYSIYTWILGAILTTAVLVIRILNTSSPSSSSSGTDGRQEGGLLLPICSLGLSVHVVLQMMQGVSMIMNVVMLGLATSHLCRYNKLGYGGLTRSDATMCVKQSWKLLLVMVFHSVFSTSAHYLDLSFVQLWQFVLLESVSIFGILVYRRSVLKHIRRRLLCIGRTPRGEAATVRRGGSSTSINGGEGLNGGSSMATQNQQYIVSEKIRLSSVV